MTGSAADSGKSHSQGRDVSQRIQVGGAVSITNPETLLSGSLKTGVVAFAFGTQSISSLEAGAFPVNGKSVSIRNSFVFCASSVLLAVVPIFMVAGTGAVFGLAKRTAKLLAQAAMTIGSLPVFVHGKTRIAEGIASREFLWVFCIALVQGNYGVSVVDIFYQIVDRVHIVALVTQEGTLLKRNGTAGGSKYFGHNGGIRHIGRGSQFIKRQTGNAIHQNVIFVAPVKFMPLFIVLVGG